MGGSKGFSVHRTDATSIPKANGTWIVVARDFQCIEQMQPPRPVVQATTDLVARDFQCIEQMQRIGEGADVLANK